MATHTLQPGESFLGLLPHYREGDEVRLAKGQHTGVKLIGRHGTAAAPVVIVGDDGAEITAGVGTGEGVNVEDCSHVRVENLTVRGMVQVPGGRAYVAGVRVMASDDVEVVACRAVDNWTWGFHFGFVRRLRAVDGYAAGSKYQHGVYVADSSSDVRVLRFLAERNALSGFHNNGDRETFNARRPTTGFIDRLSYESCTARLNGLGSPQFPLGGGAALNMDGCRDVRVTNFHAEGNRAGGIALFMDKGTGPCQRVTVEGSKIVMPPGSRVGVAVRNGSTDVVLWGNEIEHADPFRPELQVVGAGKTVRVVSDYNRCSQFQNEEADDRAMPLAEWRAKAGQDAHSVNHGEAIAEVPPTPEMPKPVYPAEVVKVEAPATFEAGKPTTVLVHLKNVGDKAWWDDFKLGTQNPQDNKDFGPNRLTLSAAGVQPGQAGTFHGSVVATKGGTMTLRPLIEDVKWFDGPTVEIPITVVPPVVPPTVPPPLPLPAFSVEADGTLAITLGAVTKRYAWTLTEKGA